MKTNQDIIRYIDTFSVVQRTSDGYFDGGELLRQWNNIEGNPRRMSEFIDSPKVKEFLKALAEDESHSRKSDIGENQLLIKVKGRSGKAHSDVLKAIDTLVSKMAENQCEGYFAETSVDIPQP